MQSGMRWRGFIVALVSGLLCLASVGVGAEENDECRVARDRAEETWERSFRASPLQQMFGQNEELFRRFQTHLRRDSSIHGITLRSTLESYRDENDGAPVSTRDALLEELSRYLLRAENRPDRANPFRLRSCRLGTRLVRLFSILHGDRSCLVSMPEDFDGPFRRVLADITSLSVIPFGSTALLLKACTRTQGGRRVEDWMTPARDRSRADIHAELCSFWNLMEPALYVRGAIQESPANPRPELQSSLQIGREPSTTLTEIRERYLSRAIPEHCSMN